MTEAKAKRGFNFMFWSMFIVATVAITELFTSYKFFLADNDLRGYLTVGISILVLVLSMFILAYEVYADEKDNNNLRVNFKPFDLMYERFGR